MGFPPLRMSDWKHPYGVRDRPVNLVYETAKNMHQDSGLNLQVTSLRKRTIPFIMTSIKTVKGHYCFIFNSFVEIIHMLCNHSFKGYNPMAFSSLTELYNHCNNLVLEHDSKKKPGTHLQSLPIPSYPFYSQTLATINLLPVSIDLFIRDISYQWNHIRCGLVCLSAFTWRHVVKVHPCCSKNQCFIPLLPQVVPYCSAFWILAKCET